MRLDADAVAEPPRPPTHELCWTHLSLCLASCHRFVLLSLCRLSTVLAVQLLPVTFSCLASLVPGPVLIIIFNMLSLMRRLRSPDMPLSAVDIVAPLSYRTNPRLLTLADDTLVDQIFCHLDVWTIIRLRRVRIPLLSHFRCSIKRCRARFASISIA